MPSLIKSFKEDKLINSSNIYDNGRLLNKVLENYRRIISQMPTVDGEGESITLNGCINAEFLKFELGGNTSQEEGASPKTPKDIHVVKGHNVITIANSDGTELKRFPLDLPEGMELCGIGNYADTFEKVNGKWYKNPKIIKEIINANTSFYPEKRTSENEFRFIFNNRTSSTFVNSYVLCNYYKNKMEFSNYSIINIYEKSVWINNPYDLNFPSEMTTTEAKAKFHELYDTKLIFYTVDTRQTAIEITDPTLISQLEAIKRALSYAGTTIITQENEDLPFNISVGALKDLHILEYANYLNE